MKLAPLKFKNYTWPHNPATYSMTYTKNTATHSYPFTVYSDVEDLGLAPREVSGEGEFIGPNAYEEFKKLASVFYSYGPGPLIHPIWDIQNAIFKHLKVEEEPTPEYVRYSFGFIEDDMTTKIVDLANVKTKETTVNRAQTRESNNKSYVVKKGDTLWHIAKRNNISLNNLINKNKQIKNPNLIYPGQKINL